MDRSKLIKRLMATFLEELQEHVRTFNRELLALEQRPSPEATAESVKVLFRAAHSLKGAARSVEAKKLEALAHGLEALLAAVRDGERTLDKAVIQQLFAGVDAFEAAGNELRSTGAAEPVSSPAPTARAVGESGSAAQRGATAAPANGAAVSPVARVSAEPAPAPERPLEPAAEAAQEALSVSPALHNPAPVAESSVVRVTGRRLDALLAQSGELLAARRRFDTRQVEIGALQDRIERWRSEWRFAQQGLTQRRQHARRGNGGGAEPANVQDAFPRLERFVKSSGEQLARVERELERLSLAFADDRRALERAAVPLQQQIHEARLVPFAEACEGLFRAVRDLASSEDKEVELVIAGGDTELDRSIVDGLRAPLLHLIRNAVSHGVEAPDARLSRGKPRRATISVKADLRGDVLELAVSDDGGGIELDAIRQQLEKRGLPVPGDEGELARMIFRPGLSTASSLTHVSGRGVGLDVVKAQIEAMRGTVQLSFQPGAGTCFVFTLPLTLTTLKVLFVKAAGDAFAFPTASVHKLVRAGAHNLGTLDGRDMLLLGEAPIPIVSLAQTLGLPRAATPARMTDKVPIVVISADEQRVAIAVDELLGHQEVVLKPLGARIRRTRHIAGATILPSGALALVLKPLDLARSALGRGPSLEWSAAFAAAAPAAPKRLLLADDSITTRTLEKSILEAAGHQVMTAADGAMAWQLLQEQGADLVVSDVEMPNMDGFALTEAIRSSKRFKNLPVILLTALHTDRDRARGLELGADAYLLKTAFDQKLLLETIRQLL